MRQVAGCIKNALNNRSNCNQQSREKEHRMDRDTDADCQRDQQRRCRWFDDCEQQFFHNASFSHSLATSVSRDNHRLSLAEQILLNFFPCA